ncbi:hypothetical protein NMY22_g7981 [Coprinellus aureogranulatus]|nr:hypothetical protein NMY22_g7981 [Coprinellus aureogranulatus]
MGTSARVGVDCEGESEGGVYIRDLHRGNLRVENGQAAVTEPLGTRSGGSGSLDIDGVWCAEVSRTRLLGLVYGLRMGSNPCESEMRARRDDGYGLEGGCSAKAIAKVGSTASNVSQNSLFKGVWGEPGARWGEVERVYGPGKGVCGFGVWVEMTRGLGARYVGFLALENNLSNVYTAFRETIPTLESKYLDARSRLYEHPSCSSTTAHPEYELIDTPNTHANPSTRRRGLHSLQREWEVIVVFASVSSESEMNDARLDLSSEHCKPFTPQAVLAFKEQPYRGCFRGSVSARARKLLRIGLEIGRRRLKTLVPRFPRDDEASYRFTKAKADIERTNLVRPPGILYRSRYLRLANRSVYVVYVDAEQWSSKPSQKYRALANWVREICENKMSVDCVEDDVAVSEGESGTSIGRGSPAGGTWFGSSRLRSFFLSFAHPPTSRSRLYRDTQSLTDSPYLPQSTNMNSPKPVSEDRQSSANADSAIGVEVHFPAFHSATPPPTNTTSPPSTPKSPAASGSSARKRIDMGSKVFHNMREHIFTPTKDPREVIEKTSTPNPSPLSTDYAATKDVDPSYTTPTKLKNSSAHVHTSKTILGDAYTNNELVSPSKTDPRSLEQASDANIVGNARSTAAAEKSTIEATTVVNAPTEGNKENIAESALAVKDRQRYGPAPASTSGTKGAFSPLKSARKRTRSTENQGDAEKKKLRRGDAPLADIEESGAPTVNNEYASSAAVPLPSGAAIEGNTDTSNIDPSVQSPSNATPESSGDEAPALARMDKGKARASDDDDNDEGKASAAQPQPTNAPSSLLAPSPCTPTAQPGDVMHQAASSTTGLFALADSRPAPVSRFLVDSLVTTGIWAAEEEFVKEQRKSMKPAPKSRFDVPSYAEQAGMMFEFESNAPSTSNAVTVPFGPQFSTPIPFLNFTPPVVAPPAPPFKIQTPSGPQAVVPGKTTRCAVGTRTASGFFSAPRECTHVFPLTKDGVEEHLREHGYDVDAGLGSKDKCPWMGCALFAVEVKDLAAHIFSAHIDKKAKKKVCSNVTCKNIFQGAGNNPYCSIDCTSSLPPYTISYEITHSLFSLSPVALCERPPLSFTPGPLELPIRYHFLLHYSSACSSILFMIVLHVPYDFRYASTLLNLNPLSARNDPIR